MGKEKPCLSASIGLSGVTNGSLVAHGQSMTALCPPPGQYRPAGLTLHARAKPVRLCPLAVVRLKCAFRHIDSLRPPGQPPLGDGTPPRPSGDTRKFQYRGPPKRLSNRPGSRPRFRISGTGMAVRQPAGIWRDRSVRSGGGSPAATPAAGLPAHGISGSPGTSAGGTERAGGLWAVASSE